MEREASKEAVTLDRSYDRSDDRLLRVYQGISQSWESQWKCRALRTGSQLNRTPSRMILGREWPGPRGEGVCEARGDGFDSAWMAEVQNSRQRMVMRKWWKR